MRSREKDFRISGEPSSPEIVTVPDCSYTISQLLEKFTRGVVPSVVHDPVFYEENDDVSPELERLEVDRLDIYEMSEEISARIASQKAQISSDIVEQAPDIKEAKTNEN